MEASGRETIRRDRADYERAGIWSEKKLDRDALRRVLGAGLRRTEGTFRNLTGTLAQYTARQFTAAMDEAWLSAATGTIDPKAAGRRAIMDLCRQGVTTVTYPSGHTDHLEVAVRRALITGVNQSAMELQNALADQLGSDLVETTAHFGARPDHEVWQGKVFSRSGSTPGYPGLAAGTGYGTGSGLGGWNCRHSFHPFFEGWEPAYSEAQLQKYADNTCTYAGKQLTEYEASQVQRAIERGIRRWKRTYLGLEAAGEDTTEAAVKLKAWREKEADFLKQTGRLRDSSRSQIPGFGRSQAGRATWTAKKEEKNRWFIENDAKLKAESSLPKRVDIPDVRIAHTVNVNLENLHGVVPNGSLGTRAYVMAGNGTSTPIRDLKRLYSTYPEYGDASGWQKVSATVYGKSHHYVVHWYQNGGKVPPDEIKLKGAK